VSAHHPARSGYLSHDSHDILADVLTACVIRALFTQPSDVLQTASPFNCRGRNSVLVHDETHRRCLGPHHQPRETKVVDRLTRLAACQGHKSTSVQRCHDCQVVIAAQLLCKSGTIRNGPIHTHPHPRDCALPMQILHTPEQCYCSAPHIMACCIEFFPGSADQERNLSRAYFFVGEGVALQNGPGRASTAGAYFTPPDAPDNANQNSHRNSPFDCLDFFNLELSIQSLQSLRPLSGRFIFSFSRIKAQYSAGPARLRPHSY